MPANADTQKREETTPTRPARGTGNLDADKPQPEHPETTVQTEDTRDGFPGQGDQRKP